MVFKLRCAALGAVVILIPTAPDMLSAWFVGVPDSVAVIATTITANDFIRKRAIKKLEISH